jgi:hypothetical protein
MAADTQDLSFHAAPNRRGSRSGDKNNRWSLARRFQRKLQVRADLHRLAGKFFHQQALHFFLCIRLSGSGQPSANSSYVVRGDIRGLHGQTRRFANRRQRASKSNSIRVGRATAALRTNTQQFVHEHAVRFSAAAVETQNKSHG